MAYSTNIGNYVANEWSVGLAITQERMTNIENGILNAHAKADDLNNVAIPAVNSSISDLNTQINEQNVGLVARVSALESAQTTSSTWNTQGHQAWVQIEPLLKDTHGTDRTLKQYIVDTLELQISNNTDLLGRINDELQAARASRGNATFPTIFDSFDSAIAAVDAKIIEGKGTYSTLGARFQAIEGDNGIGGLATRMTAAEGHLTASAGEDGAIETRIDRIDTAVKTAARGNGATSLNNRFEISEQKLSDALTSTAKGNTTFGSIDARFEEIESEIVAARGSRADLDARLDKIDSLADSESLAYTVNNNSSVIGSHTSAISNLSDGLSASNGRISSLEGQIVNKVNRSDIVNNETTAADVENKVLDARMGKTLHDEITTASNNLSTSIGTVADRATALEGRATQLESDVSGINTALAGKVDYTDIIDDLTQVTEQTVNKVLDAQVGVDLSERIDAISEQLTGGFEDRIDVLETVLDLDENGDSTRLDGIDALLNGVLESEANNDTTYASVDARLEADEISINGMTANVFKIARELEMVSNGSIIDNNEGTSRIDRLETAVNALPSTSDLEAIGDQVDAVEARVDALYLEDENEPGTYTGIVQDLLDADTGFDSRLDALEETVDTPTTGLSARMTAAETSLASKAAASDLTTLAGRVTVLENTPKSATVIVPNTHITYDENTGLPTIYTTAEKTTVVSPVETSDYLLEGTDNKYYYWKYITAEDTHWQKISGGGGSGSGNNSGYDMVAADYDANNFRPAENTDYYVLRDDGVHHYRWVMSTPTDPNEQPALEEVEIGTPVNKNEIKRYNVRIATETRIDTTTNEEITEYFFYLYQFGYGEDSEINDQGAELTPAQLEYLAAHQIRRLPMPAGGGGATVNQMKFTPISSTAFAAPLNSDSPILIQYFFTTGEPNEGAYYDILVDGRKVSSDNAMTSGNPADKQYTWPTGTVPAGFYSLDVTRYLTTTGVHRVVIQARHANNAALTAYIVFNIELIDFRLESSAAEGRIVSTEESVTISYIPFGDINKTLHVVIDNDTAHELTYVIGDIQGVETSVLIPAQTHGLHKIDMYMTAVADNKTIYTSHVYREYIWYDETDTTHPIIIASPYNGQTIDIDAYTELTIPYSIYHKEEGTYQIEYYLNYGTASENMFNIENASGNVESASFVYIPTVAQKAVETQTITIKVDNVTAVLTMHVNPIDADLAPIDGAIIDFDPSLYTNQSISREPTWKTKTTAYDSYLEWEPSKQYTADVSYVIYNGYAYKCRETCNDSTWTPAHWQELGAKEYTFKTSDNFNWSNDVSGGGYKEDEDGKCFVIKAGSYVDLNYKMFKQSNGRSAVYDTGMEMKIIFKTMAVRNVDAVWFTNVKKVSNKDVGIQLEAHKGWLKTDKASSSSINVSSDYTPWAEETSYAVDAIVLIKDTIYKCIKAHVSVAASLKTEDEDAWDDYIKTNWLSLGKIETSVDSTNTYLYFPYSEEDKIELDINVNQYAAGNNFIMSYEDGVPSKAYPYNYSESGDGLYHLVGDEATIRIGSPDCDVYIYRMRIYNKSLTTNEILQNFIADGQSVREKLNRYNRNCIYWDGKKFLNKKTLTAKLDPVKLAEQMPNVKILMLDCPSFTLSKKSYIMDSTLRCIQAPGGDMYSATDEDNWFFQNGFHAGQGTTSDNYGQAGRNVDFLFMCDGKHFPTKKKNLSDEAQAKAKSTKSTLLVGNAASKWDETTKTWKPTTVYNAQTETWEPASDILTVDELASWTAHIPEECTDWKGDACKIPLRHDSTGSVPNNYFNLKVNIASSENVNNALFAKRFGEYLAYNSPAHKRDSKVKNNMEFVPAVLFIRENAKDQQGNPVGHSEFNDCEWHFYALGNIGDSKKTDYTRAYNPKDMNEFTVENSDNNTNNGQFQSGVFYSNNERLLETDFPAWSETTAYKQGDKVIVNQKIYKRTAADMVALGENETATWVAADWSDVTPTTTETIKYAPRTNPNPMDYVYPISSEEWNVQLDDEYVNRKHMTLVTEDFDGDHSFEFRYACMGDYRDGDLINDTTGKASEQFNINHSIVMQFYEWLVTASPAQFRAEASHWFVPEAMEFFYAYTHYYTMMDNRAKNTFWHWGKRYISTSEANGTAYNTQATLTATAQATYDDAASNYDTVKATQDLIIAQADATIAEADAALAEDAEDAEALAAKAQATADKEAAQAEIAAALAPKTAAEKALTTQKLKRDELKYLYDYADCFTVSDTEAAINNGRRFDMWAYDMDTAAGIDNNGALVFPYGKEDKDYRVKGVESSGWAFNGAGSIFWRRLSDPNSEGGFADEIREIMNSTNKNCFNSEHLIKEFDDFQQSFPEEIWRLDIERKYIRTFTGASVDNSITLGKQNSRFLTSMMQGRKKYQRRQWIRNQGVYFNSKYRLSDITNATNTTEFNIITPTGNLNELAVYPSYNLKLTPYQDMYLNVTIGNGGPTPQIRAEAGKEYTIDLLPYSSGTFAETRLYIYGFNYISGLGNLAAMYPYSFTLSALGHLKVLDIGTDTVGYINANLTELPLTEESKLPLLETLNIKNCSYLSKPIGLNTANNIRTVEATGSALTGITLPDYTNIETLHLPDTVTTLSLTSARNLSDLKVINRVTGQVDYSKLTKLNIVDSDYNANINWMEIATAMLANAESIKLYDLLTSSINRIEELEPFAEKKNTLEQRESMLGLSGTLHVLNSYSVIEKSTYEALWHTPPLTLDVTGANEITKYKVDYYYDEYQLDDGTVVPRRFIATEYVVAGQPLPDIYDEGRINKPTRESTAEHEFSWGTFVNGDYVLYSGWYSEDIEITANGNPTVGSPATVYTKFIQRTRTYQVKWYLRQGDTTAVKTANAVPYNGGANLSAPTVQDIHNAGFSTYEWKGVSGGVADYEIFTGWDKLPINIHPALNETAYNIYATWHTRKAALSDILAGATDTNLTTEQLFVLSHITPADRNRYMATYGDGDGNLYTCRMGHDGPDDGTVLIDTPFRTDLGNYRIASSGMFTNIQPFNGESNAFTLVLDYCFNSTMIENAYESTSSGYPYINRAVLASCYNYNTTTNTAGGFALYYYNESDSEAGWNAQTRRGPYIGFGDIYNDSDWRQSIPIGDSSNASSRNMVVIRHEANSDTIHIYSGYGLDSNTKRSFPSTVQYKNIVWNNAHFSDGLRIGYITNKMTDENYANIRNNTAPGRGTIYWAKYWDYDIGDGECRKLAAWPHEEITFGFAKASNNQTNASASAFSLTALESTVHGCLIQQAMQTLSSYGWGLTAEGAGALARTICNQRIFNGLPVMLQSIIFKDRTSFLPVILSETGQSWMGMENYTLATSVSTSQDYVYLPSAYNLASGSTDENGNLIANTAWNKEDVLGIYNWIVPGNDDGASLNTYVGYIGSNNTWAEQNTITDRTKYWNLRFPYQPINIGPIRVFSETSWQGQSNETVKEAIIASMGSIQAGDIFISTTDHNAYMYVTQALINQYGIQINIPLALNSLLQIKNDDTDGGGWIKASPYLTRSLIPGGTQTNYCVVTTEGDPGVTAVTSSTVGYPFVFSFSV